MRGAKPGTERERSGHQSKVQILSQPPICERVAVDKLRTCRFNLEMMIHCYLCNQVRDAIYFYRDRSHISGHRRACKDCERLQYRRRRELNLSAFRAKDARFYKRHKDEIAAKRAAYYAKFGLRQRARSKVAYALLRGDLTRNPCEVCGAKKTDAHHDDYSKPLDVRWLCRKHHLRSHAGSSPAALTDLASIGEASRQPGMTA